MTSKPLAIAVAAAFLISTQVSVTQASPQSVVGGWGLGQDAALVTSATIDVSATRHYQKWYSRDTHHRYATLPYDGYRPYPPPIYHCPYYGSPIPLYPYCWGR